MPITFLRSPTGARPRWRTFRLSVANAIWARVEPWSHELRATSTSFPRSGSDDVVRSRRRRGNRQPILAQSLQVKLDRLLHEALGFLQCRAGGDAAWKIRCVGAVAGRGPFVDH